MFEKLLSVLPYSPGLSHQLAFYGRRMHEEASIRRTGLVFLLLAFMVQFFAVLSPPQPTVASSGNDLIEGGFNSIHEARRICRDNTKHYGQILDYFGIDCGDIGAEGDVCIHTGGQKYYSMGWYSVGQTYNGKSTNETPYGISGLGKPVYMRKLSIWNQPGEAGCGAHGWHALRARNSDGKTFYLLYDCGNLVSVGLPSPPTKKTKPKNPFGPFTPTEKPKPKKPETPQTPQTPVTPETPPTPETPETPETPPETPPTPPETPQTPVCEYNPLLPPNDVNCKPCDKSVSSTDSLACVFVSKTATNVTTGQSDANNTTAHGGDVITYTLYAQNKGKAKIKDFVFQENLADVLDYADATDLHGGSLNGEKTVTWAAIDIEPGQTVSQQVTVKVKNPVPQTPASSSDPAHFDLIMTNVYGNAINIKLPGSPAKQVEVAATQLPNTGPGTTLMIAAAIVVVAGYFYSRAGLLARESELAVKEALAS